MGLISHAFDLSACLTLTVDMTHMYLVVDRDNSGVPPDGERSGRYKESPPKKEMIMSALIHYNGFPSDFKICTSV